MKDLPLQPTCVCLVECAFRVSVRKGEIVATAIRGIGKAFDAGMLNSHISPAAQLEDRSWKTSYNSHRRTARWVI
jgi:hypothetical protein